MNEFVRPVILWVTAVNVLGFVLMGVDKWKARRGAWRVPEKTLYLPALLGGAPGVIAGMRVFRHKTRHAVFRYGLPALLLVQVGAAVWLLRKM